ncbi:hypothetical protein ACWGB8_37570 [Kitasatospora sp. NPDC054939]
MDLLTYKALDQGPDAPAHPSRMHRAWHWLLSLSPTAVVFLTALSLGLGEVGSQVDSIAAMTVFSIIWFITAVALFGMFARWLTPAKGRHRMAA